MLKSFAITSALIVAAVPAHAATMKAVYTGIVSSGYDYAGIFSDPWSSLDGMEFELTFVYDTLLGYRETGSYYDSVSKGKFLAETGNPMISASLKLNGVVEVLTGGDFGWIEVWSKLPTSSGYMHAFNNWGHTAGVDSRLFYLWMENDWQGGITPNLDLSATLDEVLSRHFSYFYIDVCYAVGVCYSGATGDLQASQLSVTPYDGSGPAPVPLPGAGGLFMVALGAVGAGTSLCRRNGSSCPAKTRSP